MAIRPFSGKKVESAFTPTGSMSQNTSYTGRYIFYPNSKIMVITYKVGFTGAPESLTDLYFDMVSGWQVDQDRLLFGAVDGATFYPPLACVGNFSDFDGGTIYPVTAWNYLSDTRIYPLHLTSTSTPISLVFINDSAPVTVASGDNLVLQVTFPVESA